jgi:hypothetical protein
MKKSKNKFLDISQSEIWDAENIFHLKTNVSRISQILYHYELYKLILSVPGDIIECGVFKGNSLIRFLTYRSLLENNFSREVYGFDVFGKFPSAKIKKDKNFIKTWNKKANQGININELNTILKDKKFENYELIKGNVINTIPKFLKRVKNLKLAILHLDMDIYEPTKFALNRFSKYMAKGGIIIIDDYSRVSGATDAVDEFIKKNNRLKLEKLHFYSKPAFIRF